MTTARTAFAVAPTVINGAISLCAASAPDAEDLALTAVKQPPFPTAVGANKFSSGGVLGIHEPGSQTWGGRKATAPSGRADDSATCPDATRFSSPSSGEPEGRRALRPAPGCAAAFNLSSRSMRLSFGASSTTAACDITTPRVAAAFSSEIPEAPLWVRQAVAAVGSASAATANRALLKNAKTFFVAAASVIAAKSKSVSLRS